MGDHPPITPTVKIPNSLSGDEKRMYGYIVRHFLGSISKDAKFLSTQIKISLNGLIFQATGT